MLRLQFARQAKQKGNEGFVPFEDLGDVVEAPAVVGSLREWHYAQNRNACVVGLLRIDEPGTYVFRTYNYYDRCALYVDGKLVSPYRGSQARGTDSGDVTKNKERIYLSAGWVPLVCVGYVDARSSVKVWWSRPGQSAYEPIPDSLLKHDSSWESAATAAEIWQLVHQHSRKRQ